MANPTGKTLQLPKEVNITDHKNAKFVKQIGANDNEAMLVLEPTTSSKISALDKTGAEVYIRKLDITKLERDVVKKAESIYSEFIRSEDILLKAYPNKELTEKFPEHEHDRVPDSIREYQSETNRQEEQSEEFLEHPNIKSNGDKMILTEYSKLGELPISDKTDPTVKTMAHLLASIGCSMQLLLYKRKILQIVLNQYNQKPIVKFRKELQNDFEKNRILEIYKVWPVRLALQAHIFITEASISLRRINLTKAKKEHKLRQQQKRSCRLHAR